MLLAAGAASAQHRTFDVGGQITVAEPGAFGTGDVGVGARLAARPAALLGVEGEVDVYPAEYPSDTLPFSSSRVEALFGVTIGPKLGIIRPFARVRPGLLRYAEAPGPVICIATFPPPLSCQLAAGQNLFVIDVGGGMEIDAGSRSYVRLDLGDRIVRYPAPAPIGHDLRVGVGWGVRFSEAPPSRTPRSFPH